jgi:hypothetical protein
MPIARSAALLLLVVAASRTATARQADSPLESATATIRAAERTLVTVDRTEAPLTAVLEDFRKAGLQIQVEWSELALLGVEKDEPVTLIVERLPALDALAALSRVIGDAKERPVLDAAPGLLVLTTGDRLEGLRVPAIYDVADILTDPTLLADAADADAPAHDATSTDATTIEERARRLLELLMSQVDPQGWEDVGGSRGRISVEAGRLVVSATPLAHLRLRRLLDDLRRESPFAIETSLSIMEVPSATATRLADEAKGDATALAAAVRGAADATRAWSPRVVTRFDAPASIETSDDALGQWQATLTPRRDRIARVITLDLHVTLAKGSSKVGFDGLVAFDVVPRPVAIVLPTTDGAATARILVIDITPQSRDGGTPPHDPVSTPPASAATNAP